MKKLLLSGIFSCICIFSIFAGGDVKRTGKSAPHQVPPVISNKEQKNSKTSQALLIKDGKCQPNIFKK